MSAPPGARPSQPTELTRAEDRISFLYLEHCTIGRDANALTATDEQGVLHIPGAALGVLMLGPGTRVTHQAMSVIADSGASVVWTGENGVRYYAHGRPIGRSTRLLELQAKLVSNRRSRLEVARRMYAMRFPGEDVSGLTMQQLRGREGARVRAAYRRWSSVTGVPWGKRDYRPDDFDASDSINQALSAAHACLYGVVHAVIVALGCSPGLGFVHVGHDRAFVYDMADLYKAEVTIPIAFESVAALSREVGEGEEIPRDVLTARVRRGVRDAIREERVLSRCVADLKRLLGASMADDEVHADVVELWDFREGRMPGGANYAAGDEPW
ncbi:type I-E CRISPR-associated endonuclease Cas1e [Corynebacterium sp.]|uniref:type I-E CRISPR-associated endonuclease Cas1e n=1 Tax=Corynebacterium sp. TaxID=1720 RepID=UPI0026DB2308|nr:type I-E CRISPR-associated endonuclease Cas1e [Corynebacterium sp.]MDO4610387.1 type I-E CRISPR-associated endonuclease Cas1e [Corynebacterium sp.]